VLTCYVLACDVLACDVLRATCYVLSGLRTTDDGLRAAKRLEHLGRAIQDALGESGLWG
jgi:hypothetical protein